MTEDKAKKEQKGKLISLTSIGGDQGMVCGPDGCSLADHFDWAKKAKDDKKKK